MNVHKRFETNLQTIFKRSEWTVCLSKGGRPLWKLGLFTHIHINYIYLDDSWMDGLSFLLLSLPRMSSEQGQVAESAAKRHEELYRVRVGAVMLLVEGRGHSSKHLLDYASLLNEITATPTNPKSQFLSRVGLGRVALLAGALGIILGAHVVLLVIFLEFPSLLTNWCLYVVAMCVYHWSEFLLTALHHPESVTFDSFLVNQSKEFGIAIVAGWIEFAVESFFLPYHWKFNFLISALGLGMITLGQTFRSLAMYEAGPSFTHLVVYSKEPEHKLVTNGVYSLLRHPGYFGWFYWSLGTQVLLGNPFCLIAYFVVARNFFKNRIADEESALVGIFGSEYLRYRMQTPFIGIPI